MKWSPLFFFSFVFSAFFWTLQAQTSFVNFAVENDFFFIKDRYYSSGLFLQTGKKRVTQAKDSLVQYGLWELGQKIYTPRNPYAKDSQEYDYPYGGWLYLQHSRQKVLSPTQQIEVGLQLGATGNWSLGRWSQNIYHQKLMGLRELNWIDQLPNALHLNIFTRYFYQKVWRENRSFEAQVYTHLGTQRIDLGHRMGLSIGKAKVYGLGFNGLHRYTEGIGAYIGMNTHYVFHDYMNQGSLFNDEALFTAELVPWRLHFELGMVLQKDQWRLLLFYKNRSRDNRLQPKSYHHLMSVGLSRLF